MKELFLDQTPSNTFVLEAVAQVVECTEVPELEAVDGEQTIQVQH
jgi:hypothetical protein